MSAATLKPAKDWYWTAATVRSRSGIAFQRAGTVASTVQVVVASASEGRTTSSARNLFMCDLLSACEERAHRAGFRYQSVIVTTSTCPASRREARPVMNVWNSLVSICVEDGDDALMPWPMMTIVA